MPARARWYAARHDDVPQDAADAVDTILDEWGPGAYPEERSRYACSPHRIAMAARLIRDGYVPDYANAALRRLPEWPQGAVADREARCPDPGRVSWLLEEKTYQRWLISKS